MIVVEVVFLVIFWTWLGSALLFLRNTILPRLPLLDTPEHYGLPAQTVRFPATDGQWLEGWKIPAESSRGWIIICHGLGANRSHVLPLAAGLHANRFSVFVFDFRGHGGSAGRCSSFGWHEQLDLEGALAFLGAEADVPARPYGIIGVSMGAVVALAVASSDERIGAVVAESPYHNLEQSLRRHVRLFYPWLPNIPFGWYLSSTYRMRFGVWPRRIDCRRFAARLTPRPLLLIGGSEDIRVPVAWMEEVFASAQAPKQLWIVEGAGHLDAFSKESSGYVERVAKLLSNCL